MSLRDKLEAHVRGEVSTGDLASYSSANSAAYDMLDGLPPEGDARLAAWCAFVLQTHADNLVSSGSASGFCEQEAYDEARVLYELVGGWLDRARRAGASGDWKHDVVIPAPYPRPRGAQGRAELEAMRKTLETVQARAGVDLAARKGDPIYDRLSPALAAVQSALDAAVGLAAGHSPAPELQGTLAQTLLGGLDRAYQAGQLMAKPELLALPKALAPLPGPAGSAALTLFLPGDPGFDPWCLTDPIERRARQDDGVSAGQLAELWQSDPDPSRTLAIQTEIAAALEAGSVDYLPDDLAGSLHVVSSKRPWPGAMYVYAQAGVSIGGQQLDEGDRFILAVGGGAGDGFQRAIVRLSAKAAKQLTSDDEERMSGYVGAGGGGFGAEDVFSGLGGVGDLVTLGFDVLGLWS